MDRRLLIFLIVIAVGISARLILLDAPGTPLTDVYYYDTQAVRYLANGANPYGSTYNVPTGLATPGAMRVFAYLPGTFAFLAPGLGAADVRLGLLAADVVTAGSLFLMGSRKALAASALYFLFPPDVLFSTWFVNNSLPAIAFISLSFLSELRNRHSLAGIFMGLSLASSQELWFVFPFFILYSFRRGTYRPALISLATAFALIAPFLVWDYSSFVNDTIIFQFSRSALPLFSTGPFGLNVNPSLEGILRALGTSAPIFLRGGLTSAVLVLLLLKTKTGLSPFALLGAIFTSVASFFLSANLFWAYLELPLFLLLVGFVLNELERVNPLNA